MQQADIYKEGGSIIKIAMSLIKKMRFTFPSNEDATQDGWVALLEGCKYVEWNRPLHEIKGYLVTFVKNRYISTYMQYAMRPKRFATTLHITDKNEDILDGSAIESHETAVIDKVCDAQRREIFKEISISNPGIFNMGSAPQSRNASLHRMIKRYQKFGC